MTICLSRLCLSDFKLYAALTKLIFVWIIRNRRRRAKALLDFERHDDDELGFRKNDIVTVRKQRAMLLVFRLTRSVFLFSFCNLWRMLVHIALLLGERPSSESEDLNFDAYCIAFVPKSSGWYIKKLKCLKTANPCGIFCSDIIERFTYVHVKIT